MTTLNSFVRDAALTLITNEGSEELVSELIDDRLKAKSVGGSAWVEFDVNEYDRYITLTIKDWQGIADGPGKSLQVSISGNDALHMTELDYMSTCHTKDGVSILEWLSPQKHFGRNPPGSFAVFKADTDEEHDETLLHIWVEQNQPHEHVAGEWTLERARTWLTDWQELFASRSQMVVNADSLQELYDLVPYAEKAAIDEIYIFTNTWRPDKFWPMTDVNWALNSKVFPNGRADLRAYSDHLASKGIRLCLHYVSGGIGLHDPVYVGSKPHPELAAWGPGTLLETIDDKQMDLRVRPGGELTLPLHKREFLDPVMIQVGDEMILPKETTVEPDGSWLLKGCTRGSYDTSASSHANDADVKFLVVPYGQNFVPDNNSDLFDEIADGYAGLLNECRISHVEFDGAEIHCYDGNYGYIKFAQRIYEQMGHPVTSHDSSGSAARCFFEYRFKSSQKVLSGSCRFTHGNWLIPFQVDSASRPATNLLDANFFLGQGHRGGAMGMSKPEPMFGITTDMLAEHGLTDLFLSTLHDWKEACRLLSNEQHAMIEESLAKSDWPMPEASNHRVSDTVYAVSRTGSGYALIPTRVMTRKHGDVKWQLGQEHGPVSPRQFVKPGETLELENPFIEQSPEFIVRVLPGFDQSLETVPVSAVSAKSGGVADDKDFFVAGNEPGATSKPVIVQKNIDLMRSDFDGLLEAKNEKSDPEYHVSDLPAYSLGVDLIGHRGIGIEIEGDGSGALVAVQLEGHGSRDYVIPIDFEGTKFIEVPNGEVAWSRADWGWRMRTKHMDYTSVAQCRIGLGMIPGKTSASVRIHRLVALSQQAAALENPCVRINESCLQVDGHVSSGHYLVYRGGDEVKVYDPDWHFVEELTVSRNDLLAGPGANTVTVETMQESKHPWLEIQLLVKDEPILLNE